MSRVITFSRTYPSYHPKAGQPTHFVEKVLLSVGVDSRLLFTNNIQLVSDLSISGLAPKHHTIRAGQRWKVGDWFSPRVWSGKPYNSKQIQFAPDIQIKKTWDIEVVTEADDSESDWSYMNFLGNHYTYYSEEYTKPLIKQMALNDGFNCSDDLWEWIRPKTRNTKPMIGQIICWNESIEY